MTRDWLSDPQAPQRVGAPAMDGLQQVLRGVWRATARHPDWQPGEDWPRVVAWHAVATPAGAILIDPQLDEEIRLDALVDRLGGCAAIVRTVFWHQRSCAELAARYDAPIWAHPGEARAEPYDLALDPYQPLLDTLVPWPTSRADEILLWLPQLRALIAGDVLLRGDSGRLQLCPESWLNPQRGRAALRKSLAPLLELPVKHVLVSHGQLLMGDALRELRTALKPDTPEP